MKKPKAQKQSKRPNFKLFSLFVAGILLVCIVVVQFWFNAHLLHRIMKLEGTSVKTLIIDAIHNINKDAVVEPQTGRVYLPEVRLVLPPPPQELFTGIAYSYSPASQEGNGLDEELQITSKFAMGYGTASLNRYDSEDRLFEAVPIAQACSRQILVRFKPVTDPGLDGYKKIDSKQLADGRTVELFATDKCPANSESMINYVKQIQSY